MVLGGERFPSRSELSSLLVCDCRAVPLLRAYVISLCRVYHVDLTLHLVACCIVLCLLQGADRVSSIRFVNIYGITEVSVVRRLTEKVRSVELTIDELILR